MITLVLLPGLDGTGILLEPFLAALPATCEALVMRYPTTLPAGYEALVDRVRVQLPGDRPYVLLGESFSGPVALLLAAERPPMLRGVVLSCTFAGNPHPWASGLRSVMRWLPMRAVPSRWLGRLLMGRWTSPALQQALAEALASVSVEALRARLNAVLAADVSSALRQVAVPMLYLQAAQDWVVPAAAGQRVRQLKADLQWASFDAPHFLLQTHSRQAAEAICSFAAALMVDPMPEA